MADEEKEEKQEERRGQKRRVFFIVCDVVHPVTGETLLTEEKIQEALAHRCCKDFAYILHDRDVYLEKDEKENPEHVAGTPKHPHWHIVVRCNPALNSMTMAKWLGIPENFIAFPSGRYAFEDCLTYLTHEDDKQQKLGKELYSADEVKTSCGLDYVGIVERILKDRRIHGRVLSSTESLYYDVLYKGMKVEEAMKTYPVEVANNIGKVEQLRKEYVTRVQERPRERLNFYISGNGGSGKSTLSRWIARYYIDREDTLTDEQLFFCVGGPNATFEGYEGQPVIIWDDCRSMDLLSRLGSRGKVFDVFDTHSKSSRTSIKYGSVELKNSINIVNSVQSFKEFIDGLSGEYTDKTGTVHKSEDKRQARRRFPIFIPLSTDFYEVYVNVGVLDGTDDFDHYYRGLKVRANIPKIASKFDAFGVYDAETDTTIPLKEKTVRPILKEGRKIEEALSNRAEDKDPDQETLDEAMKNGDVVEEMSGEKMSFDGDDKAEIPLDLLDDCPFD